MLIFLAKPHHSQPELLKVLGITKQALSRRRLRAGFPDPVKIGRVNFFNTREILDWHDRRSIKYELV